VCVEYRLTEKGAALAPIYEAIAAWILRDHARIAVFTIEAIGTGLHLGFRDGLCCARTQT